MFQLLLLNLNNALFNVTLFFSKALNIIIQMLLKFHIVKGSVDFLNMQTINTMLQW